MSVRKYTDKMPESPVTNRAKIEKIERKISSKEKTAIFFEDDTSCAAEIVTSCQWNIIDRNRENMFFKVGESFGWPLDVIETFTDSEDVSDIESENSEDHFHSVTYVEGDRENTFSTWAELANFLLNQEHTPLTKKRKTSK